jgi:hypothetical protein
MRWGIPPIVGTYETLSAQSVDPINRHTIHCPLAGARVIGMVPLPGKATIPSAMRAVPSGWYD